MKVIQAALIQQKRGTALRPSLTALLTPLAHPLSHGGRERQMTEKRMVRERVVPTYLHWQFVQFLTSVACIIKSCMTRCRLAVHQASTATEYLLHLVHATCTCSLACLFAVCACVCSYLLFSMFICGMCVCMLTHGRKGCSLCILHAFIRLRIFGYTGLWLS